MENYNVIGLMSGSSLDGVDIAYCQFSKTQEEGWQYQVIAAETIPYDPKWVIRLQHLDHQNAITFIKTHTFYGHYLGNLVNSFIESKQIQRSQIDFITSHGHTIFHNPRNMFTCQIGDGAAIATRTQLPVICNLRTSDVSVGGQGAPIVPIGDKHLFAKHKFCLNLGGISNISCKLDNGNMLGFDISPNNLALNYLAQKINLPYDANGEIAATGNVVRPLLEQLDATAYYQRPIPKSLSNGWVNKFFLPMLEMFDLSIEDKMRTLVEHIAMQISRDIRRIYQTQPVSQSSDDSILVTGGGAHHRFLIEQLASVSPVKVVIPSLETVDFKEAIVMGFIGVLRARGEANVLSSVTGADRDTVNGAIYYSN